MQDAELVRPELVVGVRDEALNARLSEGLTSHNVRATGIDDDQGLSVHATDAGGDLVAGLSGWTWGTCAGIEMVWVREDCRGQRWGSRLLATAEGEARRRGCVQIIVSSLTFQAPGFYQKHGYVERGRTDGLPVAGHSDVYFTKVL